MDSVEGAGSIKHLLIHNHELQPPYSAAMLSSPEEVGIKTFSNQVVTSWE